MSQNPNDLKRILVNEILELDKKIAEQELVLKDLKTKLTVREAKLVDSMVDDQIQAVRFEDGVQVGIKMKIFTNFLVKDREQVFEFLRSIDRDDAIKTDVNKNTLRSIITKYIEEEGKEVPPCIQTWLEKRVEIKEGTKSLRLKASKIGKGDYDE